MTQETIPVLSIRNLRVQRAGFQPLTLPELDLHAKEVVGLVGPSGCGKTTLLQGMLGLQESLQVEGSRSFCASSSPASAWPASNTEAWRQILSQQVTYLMQDAKAALDPLQRVGLYLQMVTGQDRQACRDALLKLAMPDADRILRAYPHELSGGQAQRVLLAVAFLRRSPLLILDEPAVGLDPAAVQELLSCLQQLQAAQGTAILLTSHDATLLRELQARCLVCSEGSFVPGQNPTAQWPAFTGPQAGPDAILQARGLGVQLGGRWILRSLQLSIQRAEVVAVVGPSGCGKTTLARVLAGHLPASEGQLQAPGNVQLLFQDAFASLTPQRRMGSLLQETAVSAFNIADEAKELGLQPSHLQQTAATLSGGERRRMALLRALSVQPDLLILDEPTAFLDPEAALAVVQSLQKVLARQQPACLLITHDLELARQFAGRILAMEEGKLC